MPCFLILRNLICLWGVPLLNKHSIIYIKIDIKLIEYFQWWINKSSEFGKASTQLQKPQKYEGDCKKKQSRKNKDILQFKIRIKQVKWLRRGLFSILQNCNVKCQKLTLINQKPLLSHNIKNSKNVNVTFFLQMNMPITLLASVMHNCSVLI